MMCAVDCCPPYTHTDEGKNGNGKFMLARLYGIYGSYKHVGCMQRRNCSKHIAVVAVNRLEHWNAKQLVEST